MQISPRSCPPSGQLVLLKIYDLIFKFRNKSSILDLLFLTVPTVRQDQDPPPLRDRERRGSGSRRGTSARRGSRVRARHRLDAGRPLGKAPIPERVAARSSPGREQDAHSGGGSPRARIQPAGAGRRADPLPARAGGGIFGNRDAGGAGGGQEVGCAAPAARERPPSKHVSQICVEDAGSALQKRRTGAGFCAGFPVRVQILRLNPAKRAGSVVIPVVRAGTRAVRVDIRRFGAPRDSGLCASIGRGGVMGSVDPRHVRTARVVGCVTRITHRNKCIQANFKQIHYGKRK